MTTTDTAAEFSVFCPGMLEVLSIGKGDLRLEVGGDKPEDIAKARALIEEMLEKGYGIFVETKRGPRRVKRFQPKTMTYLIEPPEEPKPGTKRAPLEAVPVAGSKATAVGRTSGG